MKQNCRKGKDDTSRRRRRQEPCAQSRPAPRSRPTGTLAPAPRNQAFPNTHTTLRHTHAQTTNISNKHYTGNRRKITEQGTTKIAALYFSLAVLRITRIPQTAIRSERKRKPPSPWYKNQKQ
jgi:hypothetical protein